MNAEKKLTLTFTIFSVPRFIFCWPVD